MMIGKEYFTQKKTPVMIVIIILILGGVFYFLTGAATKTAMNSSSTEVITDADLFLLKDIQLKAMYTEEGTIDIFALAKNNALAKVNAFQGNSIPEAGGMVLGNVEGSMMREEGEFKNIGDNLIDYDITFRIDGVLAKTGTFVDDFHFINSEQFTELTGDSNTLFVKFKDPTTPKLFYLYDKDNPSPVTIELSDGSMALFYKHIVGKKVYYPIIIGATEAEMMQEEKLFTKVGDTIDDFFGKDIVIAGITQETNTSLDMVHIVEKDFFNTTVQPVQGYLA